MNLDGKKVIVAGSGISGIGAVSLLCKLKAEIVLYDENKERSIREIKSKLREEIVDLPEITIIIGEMESSLLQDIDVLILSPGIPVDASFLEKVKKMGIPIWGEIELAYRFAKGKLVGITGTNGKTTTTALTGAILKKYFDSVFIVGNIGIPYTKIALNTKEDSITVAEISSFQLETIKTFAPDVSAILNITPDHLNRHKTMEAYIKVKEDITRNQNISNVCVLNYEDNILREFGNSLKEQVIFFSSKRQLEKGFYLDIDKEKIWFRMEEEPVELINLSKQHLVGIHNAENIMAAAAICYSLGVPVQVIKQGIIEFRAVEHRVEYVCEKDGVVYYNDSKGTNPDASIKAIEAMSRPTILIGGGYDKQSEFDSYIDAFQGRVKKLILIGETKEKIAETARKKGFYEIEFADTLEKAVEYSKKAAIKGDAVLLSPACASWDMFKSYEERGSLFKQYVNQI